MVKIPLRRHTTISTDIISVGGAAQVPHEDPQTPAVSQIMTGAK